MMSEAISVYACLLEATEQEWEEEEEEKVEWEDDYDESEVNE